MKTCCRQFAAILYALPLLGAACSGPGGPVVGGLQRNRPERMLIETRYDSEVIQTYVSPEAMITRLIHELSDQGLSLRIEKPGRQSAKLHFSNPQAEGYLQLEKQNEVGMQFTVKYEFRVKVRRFPSTEEQEAEINRLTAYLQSVLEEVRQPTTNNATWKD
ncbi:MAG: hypothetical protein PHP44_05615 [Kiritimatiellae bacterium]|nr:hypothetical protein [Kiritimatiellia bacterium]MDD4735566.1 hypothetical protein [Kiritimatiellia bacterium]